MRRWWACLLAVALALSLVPRTAAAQSTPLLVDRIELGPVPHDDTISAITIYFEEPLHADTGGERREFTVTVDGDDVDITGISAHADDGVFILVVQISEVQRLRLISEGADVTVSYSLDSALGIQGVSGKVTNGFRWRMGTGAIPTVAEVYGALKLYFSGSVTLSEVEGVLSGDDQTYHEKLVEEAAAGRLHESLPAGEGTNWGGEETEPGEGPGTEGWVQIGSPSRLPDSSDTCGGETAPELTGGDQGIFYWACSDENTSNGRWVPVRIPQPGVDYAWDNQLLRPGDDDYNEECLYVRRDEDGNPVLDENGNRIPAPVSRGDPVTGERITWAGNSWDPIAQKCTTRGNPGSGPVFRQ